LVIWQLKEWLLPLKRKIQDIEYIKHSKWNLGYDTDSLYSLKPFFDNALTDWNIDDFMEIFLSKRQFIWEIFDSSDTTNEVLLEIKAKIEVCFLKAKRLLHDNIINEQLWIDETAIEKLMKQAKDLITFMNNDKPKTGEWESLEFLIDCVKERIIKLFSHSLGFNAP